MNRRQQRTGRFWTLLLIGVVMMAAVYHRDKLKGIIVLSPRSAVPSDAVVVLCERVIDGDSLVVQQDGQSVEVRLEGIDCPEFDQPYRNEAKAFTAALCRNKQLHMQAVARDKYGRLVVRLFVDGQEVNAELVNAGLAWQYGRAGRLSWEENQARADKMGIWSQPQPIPPWEWRTQ